MKLVHITIDMYITVKDCEAHENNREQLLDTLNNITEAMEIKGKQVYDRESEDLGLNLPFYKITQIEDIEDEENFISG